jgi:regulator of sirC expression with transglutaminase-like and TPR domain
MIHEQIKAMITLLDDSDHEVVSIVSSKLKDLGKEIIPVLESEWKNNVLNPILQQNIGDLVNELKYISLKSDLITWKSEESNNLLKGLWLIATYQFPDLKIETLKSILKNIYLGIYIRTNPEMHPEDILKIINQVIFEDHKFESNVKNFHSTANSMFNLVLEDKKGNPVGLACIYILLAEKLNLPIYGVNLPNLFVLIFDYPGHRFYINAFNKGQIFYEKDIDDYLKQMKIESDPKFYIACNNSEIIARILNNLSFSYYKIGDTTSQSEINELLEIFKI